MISGLEDGRRIHGTLNKAVVDHPLDPVSHFALIHVDACCIPGAATVAGLVPFAIATETWGSISCPASRMGVTAIRSTYGFVGRSGIMNLAWSLVGSIPFNEFYNDAVHRTKLALFVDLPVTVL